MRMQRFFQRGFTGTASIRRCTSERAIRSKTTRGAHKTASLQ
jgi:hypothetical protein